MNFTREPIIETVITPREGCKLVVRSSKGNGQEDYFVDAVEVVSFGHSFFFRSQERPKSFLVPVSDYEVLELKETRMVLKNVTTDRSIKIGGGREAPPPRREEPADETLTESRPAPEPQQRPISKRDKRRRGRRGRDRHDYPQENTRPPQEPLPPEYPREQSSEEALTQGEEMKASFISKLFPPPPTLIKESLSRYKPAEGTEGDALPSGEKAPYEDTIFEHPPLESSSEDDNEE